MESNEGVERKIKRFKNGDVYEGGWKNGLVRHGRWAGSCVDRLHRDMGWGRETVAVWTVSCDGIGARDGWPKPSNVISSLGPRA